MTTIGGAARRLGTVVACALLAVAVTPGRGITRGPAPATCIEPNKRINMYAAELPREAGRIRLGYGFTPDSASIPGPTLELTEGDCIAITLTNTVSAATLAELRDDPLLGSGDPKMKLGVSLHVHGVKYLPSSDGTAHGAGSFVPPGESRTYVWHAAPRVVVHDRVASLGTAGYWWYHDHVAGTEHGTGGVASGLFGGLVVRRAGDLLPARTYAVGFGPNATINLRKNPDCADHEHPVAGPTCFVALPGERIEFVVFAFGDDFHTFHLHGHNWAATRTGTVSGPGRDDIPLLDNRTIGPADSFGFQIIAGEEVGPGDWMLHCHVQAHSDNGMSTFLHVLDHDGTPLPLPTPLAGAHQHVGG